MEQVPDDVPSPTDFRTEKDAREWMNGAMSRRPGRADVLRAISAALGEVGARTVLELGSGPGFLAERVLADRPDVLYTALDSSPVMHALARELLQADAGRVRWMDADFKSGEWWTGLGEFDAVVTVQAVHELRHKRHAPALYRTVHALLRPRGLFMMCDIYAGEDGASDTALFMTVEEQIAALEEAGFHAPRLLMRADGLVLFRCEKA